MHLRKNCVLYYLGYPGGTVVENLSASVGDERCGSISELRRSPGVGNSNLLQYSRLENSMDRGAWWAMVHRVAKNWTRLNTHKHTCVHTHSVYTRWIILIQIKSAPVFCVFSLNSPVKDGISSFPVFHSKETLTSFLL